MDDVINGRMSCRYKLKSSVRAAKNGNGYRVSFVSCMNLIDEVCTDDKGNSRKRCSEKVDTEQHDTYCDCFGKTVTEDWIGKARKKEAARSLYLKKI